MEIPFSRQLMDDLIGTLQAALVTKGIVNIPVLAEEIRQRNEHENIALEDIAAQLVSKAQLVSAAMEFDSTAPA